MLLKFSINIYLKDLLAYRMIFWEYGKNILNKRFQYIPKQIPIAKTII